MVGPGMYREYLLRIGVFVKIFSQSHFEKVKVTRISVENSSVEYCDVGIVDAITDIG